VCPGGASTPRRLCVAAEFETRAAPSREGFDPTPEQVSPTRRSSRDELVETTRERSRDKRDSVDLIEFTEDSRQSTELGGSASRLKLTKKAITLETSAFNGNCASSDWLRAAESFALDAARQPAGSEGWARSTVGAWDARSRATPCGSGNVFCGCDDCTTKLAERPEWMHSRHALVATAVRVVAASPKFAKAWRMHAEAHAGVGNFGTSSESFMRAGSLYSQQGDATRQELCQDNTERANEWREWQRHRAQIANISPGGREWRRSETEPDVSVLAAHEPSPTQHRSPEHLRPSKAKLMAIRSAGLAEKDQRVTRDSGES
jgi:hypothetical protein